MAGFIKTMQSSAGRLLRIVIGAALVALGAVAFQAPISYIVMFIGLVPLAAGLMGICLVGPLFGYTLTGNRRLHHA